MRTAAATGGDGVVGLAAATQHHKHQRQPSLGLLSLLRAALGTRKQEDAAGNLPPTRRLGQRRASLSGQDNKMQMASSPRGCLLAPNHRRRSPADQLVVVVPREGWWREGREGGEGRGGGGGDGDGGEIEGLASVLRPYHSLQSAGSAAVSKLELTGSAAAPPPPSQ